MAHRILQIMPGGGWWAVVMDMGKEKGMEFWPVIGWGLVQYYEEDVDAGEIVGEREVEPLVWCDERAMTPHEMSEYMRPEWEVLGYSHEQNPEEWREEAARRREEAQKKAERD